MSEFCPCISNRGICENTGCAYFLDQCPIPINEFCPAGCNNPVFDDDEEGYWEDGDE